MDINFEHPALLTLLFIIPIFWGLSTLAIGRLPLWRIFSSNFFRGLVLALLILSLAGLSRVEKRPGESSLVFCVDVSDSINPENKNLVMNSITTIDKELGEKVKRGLVVFGKDAQVIAPVEERLKPENMHWEVDTSRTNIASGLLSCMNIFPKDSKKKLLLFTDGNENMGSGLQAAKILEKQGIEVYAMELPPPPEVKEVYIKNLMVPKEVAQGEAFGARSTVENKGVAPSKGTLKLYEGDKLIKEWETNFSPGLNTFDLSYDNPKRGFLQFRAVLEAESDTNPENNLQEAFVNVRGKPRILYVQSNPYLNRKPFLVTALEGKDVEVEIRNAEDMPRTLQELLGYECIIFSNVPATALSQEQMEFLKTYVADFGGGFVMLGGELSLAQGGYADTVVEEILPVKVTAGSTFWEEKPKRVAIILLIDKSGSMSGTKLFATKKAAIELMMQLKSEDLMGVIAFDVIPYDIVELLPVKDLRSSIVSKLTRLNAGGGTDIFPAMKEAYKKLLESGAQVSHVVLLSDGNTRSVYYSYESLMEMFKQASISVSTIAIGGWLVNTRLLKDIARRTRGEFYTLDNYKELPKLIITDTAKVLTKADFHEEQFIPRLDPNSEILKSISQEQIPPLKGYSLTIPKPTAEVSLVADIRGVEDPVLANWRYGLGKAVVYTSDAEARWSSQWINWNMYNKFWSQTIHWAMRDIPRGEYALKIEESEGKPYLMIEAGAEVTSNEFDRLQLRLLSPGLEAHEVNLRQVAPRRFIANLEGYPPGSYTVDISTFKGDKLVDHATKGLLLPPQARPLPVESLSQGNNRELLETVTKLTHGKLNPGPEDLRQGTGEIEKREDLSKFLIPLAMGLFLIDIAIRRIGIV
ncbi:MAG TPA: VWA domain-containing protein [Candidatus Hypogeohydataceae bacterium YC41]